MANPHKGEFEFESGDKKYRIRFSADAICNLEDVLNKSVMEIGEMMRNPQTLRYSVIRTMFTIGLKDQHGDLDDDAIKTVFKSLDANEAMIIVLKAFNRGFGMTDEDIDKAAAEAAAKAANGGDAPENPLVPVKTSDGTSPAS